MKEFLKIGEFARLLNTTTKTLRHYEELGIFEPVYRDPLTDYRYYTREQIKDFYIIMSLRDSGIPLKEMERSISERRLKELYRDTSKRLEGEIVRLREVKESIDRRILRMEENSREKPMIIEVRDLPERSYYIHRFKPVDEADSPRIYEEAFKMEREVSKLKLPLISKGAIMSMKGLENSRYLCGALIYEVADAEGISREDLYTARSGRYLCLRYRGDTRKMNKPAMDEIKRYMEENNLTGTGEILGFSHRGAHTASEAEDYYSEIQVGVEKENA